MSWLDLFKGVVIIYVIAFMLSCLAAHAEEGPKLSTIADCPAGYVLGVQETNQPQLMAKSLQLQPEPSQQDQLIKEATEAPRQFVTGCVPKTNGVTNAK